MSQAMSTRTEWVCVCCLLKLANDDTSACKASCGTEDHPRALGLGLGSFVLPGLTQDRHWAACAVEHEGQCDLACEVDSFSASICAGCGTRLAGERHAVTEIEGLE